MLGNDSHALDSSISAGSQMREFILARAGQGLRRKMGLGEAANISSKIPVGSVTVDCGLA